VRVSTGALLEPILVSAPMVAGIAVVPDSAFSFEELGFTGCAAIKTYSLEYTTLRLKSSFTVISGFLENAFFLKKSPSDTGGNKWMVQSGCVGNCSRRRCNATGVAGKMRESTTVCIS
jgi:hypothetical protein